MPNSNPFCVAILSLAFGGIFMLSGCDADHENSKELESVMEKKSLEFEYLPTPLLVNAHRVTKRIIVGASPAGSAAFQKLRDWKVKTIISVDGASPDVQNATRAGLKYIHLPMGYDGLSQARAELMAKAVLEADGVVYIHCQLGKHRSPTAAAAICVVLAEFNNKDAIHIMEVMGTSKDFSEFWKSVAEIKPVDHQKLLDLKYDFTVVEKSSALTAMLRINELTTNLSYCGIENWKTPKAHPDLVPAHEALLLRELLAELMRGDTWKKGDNEKLTAQRLYAQRTHDAARALENLLNKSAPTDEESVKKVDAIFDNLRQSCVDCHRDFRNKK